MKKPIQLEKIFANYISDPATVLLKPFVASIRFYPKDLAKLLSITCKAIPSPTPDYF